MTCRVQLLDLTEFFFFIHRFMVLLTKVEKSSEEFMEIMQSLSSIQVCFFWHIIFHTSVTPLEE